MSSRYKIIGVSLIVNGLLIATFIAWVLTKAPTSWDWAYDYTSSGDTLFTATVTRRNVAVAWAFIIGVAIVLAGVVTLLVGRAKRSSP